MEIKTDLGEGTSVRAADMETMFYRGLNACADMPDFQTRIAEFLMEMGFDTFSYTLVGMGDKRLAAPKRLFSTLPEELLEVYDAKKYHSHDIALDYAFHNQRDIFYSDLQGDLKRTSYETDAKLVNREIFNLYRSFGYYDFYLIPMRRDGRITLFSVGACDANEGSFTRKVADNIQVSVQLAME